MNIQGQLLKVQNYQFDKSLNPTEEWFTPKYIFEELGEFDLDPCTSKYRLFDTAKKHYTIYEDGLRQEWEGRVWLNPPYGNQMKLWMNKLAKHGNGISLTAPRTDTKNFQEVVFEKATSIYFIKGRIKFIDYQGYDKGTSGFPCCLIAFGSNNSSYLNRLKNIEGKHIWL